MIPGPAGQSGHYDVDDATTNLQQRIDTNKSTHSPSLYNSVRELLFNYSLRVTCGCFQVSWINMCKSLGIKTIEESAISINNNEQEIAATMLSK